MTVFNHSGADLADIGFKLSGPHADAFELHDSTPFALKNNGAKAVGVLITPAQDQLGPLHATGQ